MEPNFIHFIDRFSIQWAKHEASEIAWAYVTVSA